METNWDRDPVLGPTRTENGNVEDRANLPLMAHVSDIVRPCAYMVRIRTYAVEIPIW